AYSVVVSNLAGVVTSAEASLQVIPGLMRFEPQSVVWADGHLRFTASGPVGSRWLLQSSTNLLDWEDSLTLTNTAGSLEFTDSTSPSALRFYRLRFAP
ncbi:MAG TPA: hypothetical protein VNT26_22770, partial [Candidatus Sulfotelmatobacter sp.]|nr:hypothetical protein [Candidatus Sulfotelmatobacter sp.]